MREWSEPGRWWPGGLCSDGTYATRLNKSFPAGVASFFARTRLAGIGSTPIRRRADADSVIGAALVRAAPQVLHMLSKPDFMFGCLLNASRGFTSRHFEQDFSVIVSSVKS